MIIQLISFYLKEIFLATTVAILSRCLHNVLLSQKIHTTNMTIAKRSDDHIMADSEMAYVMGNF